MKNYRLLIPMIAILLMMALFTGCGAARALDRAEDHVEKRLEQAEDALESKQYSSSPTNSKTLTREEAELIALKEAGLTAEEITGLHSEYDIDDGVPEWEIDFYSGGWEYDYTIHAENGTVLHSERDKRD